MRTCEKTRLLTPGAEAFSSLTSAAVLAEFSGSATLPFRLTLLERVVEGVTLRSATGAMTWSRDRCSPQYGHEDLASTAASILCIDGGTVSLQDQDSMATLAKLTHQL